MAGTSTGARKAAAARHGLSLEEYLAKIVTEKWCTKCKAWHPRTSFGADRSRGDGLSTVCAACRYERVGDVCHPGVRERRARAAEGEAWCARCRAWLPIDEVRQGKCKEHIREARREWYDRLGRERVQERVYRRKRGVGAVPAVAHELLLKATDGLCAYSCGRLADTWDHVIPVARGGRTEPGNIVPACRSCNSRKKDGNPWPWIRRMSESAINLIMPGLTSGSALLDALDIEEDAA